MRLRDLKGIGPRSEQSLIDIGIGTPEELRSIGALNAYLILRNSSNTSLNMLYALIGALEDKDWREIAKSEKTRLIMELEGIEEFKAMLEKEGTSIDI